MADKKKAGPKKTKEEKVATVRAGGAKAAVKAFALGAVSLAASHNFEGLKNFGPNAGKANAKIKVIAKTGKNKGTEVETTIHKAMANKVQPKWSPGGSLESLPETDPRFVAIRGLAKAAAQDIANKNYSGSVKAFLDSMAERGAGGGGGGMRSREELNDLMGDL